MADTPSFTKMVPGFDFLQGLVKNASSALPSIGQWVAPTLNPEEIEKRIEELRTVQFWLEQNARMLGATIQALEVQRMTLSTLKTMNVQMEDLRDSLQIRMPEASAAPSTEQASPAGNRKAAAGAGAGVVDPMQWWGALTQQFNQLAATAMKDNATDAAKNLAGAMAKQGFDAAGETLRKTMSMPADVARGIAAAAPKPSARKPSASKASAPKAPATRKRAAPRR